MFNTNSIDKIEIIRDELDKAKIFYIEEDDQIVIPHQELLDSLSCLTAYTDDGIEQILYEVTGHKWKITE